jgi:cytochrome oxidase assembly protein ShyY1
MHVHRSHKTSQEQKSNNILKSTQQQQQQTTNKLKTKNFTLDIELKATNTQVHTSLQNQSAQIAQPITNKQHIDIRNHHELYSVK